MLQTDSKVVLFYSPSSRSKEALLEEEKGGVSKIGVPMLPKSAFHPIVGQPPFSRD